MTELTPIRRGRCAGAGNWQTQYQALQMTAREAAELIRDGDTAAFAAMSNWPWELDGALAERLLETGSLEDALISRLSNPDHTFDDVLNPFSGSFRRKHSDPGWYQNLLVSGLFLQPGACHTEYAVLSATPRTDTCLLYTSPSPRD